VVTKKPINRFENKWYRTTILIIGWMLIVSLARDVWQIREGFGRIAEADRRLALEEARNISLKEKLQLVVTDEYKEKLIREKLNMQKAGEVLVVMPGKLASEAPITSEEGENTLPNWEKWWALIAN